MNFHVHKQAKQWSPVTFSVISFSFKLQVDRWWEILQSKNAPSQHSKALMRSNAEMEVNAQVPNSPCQVTDQRIYQDIFLCTWPHKCLQQQCRFFLVDKWMQGEGKNRNVLLAFQSTVRSLRKLTLRIQFGVLLRTLVLTYGGVFPM